MTQKNDRFRESDDDMVRTKRLMGALGRLPPKQHKDMKIGKRKPLRTQEHDRDDDGTPKTV
jgi:hypothetical protein